jgi:hypothetical protein
MFVHVILRPHKPRTSHDQIDTVKYYFPVFGLSRLMNTTYPPLCLHVLFRVSFDVTIQSKSSFNLLG